jgi:UDP-glucose 4-epimerase
MILNLIKCNVISFKNYKNTFKRMKKILITGGAGYIGSHTAVALFQSGWEPVIVDDLSNSDYSAIKGIEDIIQHQVIFYQGDCSNPELLNQIFTQHKIFGVIHFAAFKAVGESTQNPLKYYRNNVSNLISLIEAMEKHGVNALVFSSSCTVYGQPEVLPVSETTPRKQAESPYGNTKKIGEDILADYISSGAAMKIVSLRYFNPIGAHSSSKIGELPLGIPANLIPFITQTAIGKREKLTVFGDDYNTSDGTCIRDYIHVMDLADAHVKALQYLTQQNSNFYDIFNVGTGNGNTVMEVINTFEKVSGVKLNYKIGAKRAGDIEKVWASTDKINQVLQWYPQYSLEDGLRDAWAWELYLQKENSSE